jgi:hypothetical protein
MIFKKDVIVSSKDKLVSEIKNFEYNSFKEDIDNYFKDN